MSDIVKTDDVKEPSKIEQILERAAGDETFRDQLFNDFDTVATDYQLSQDDMEALGEAYNSYVEAGMIEVLDGRDNPLSISCCCCSPCCCCCA